MEEWDAAQNGEKRQDIKIGWFINYRKKEKEKKEKKTLSCFENICGQRKIL